jgi:hypothetical protein
MSTAASLKRERDDTGAVSSEEDFFTPSSSPSPYKKPKSPSATNETSDVTSCDPAETAGEGASSTATNGSESGVSATKTEQLEQIFKNMRLRRIVKENHSSEINQVTFCLNPKHNKTSFGLDHVKVFEKRGAVKRDPMDNSNILGTTGGPQVLEGRVGGKQEILIGTDILFLLHLDIVSRQMSMITNTVEIIWISCHTFFWIPLVTKERKNSL